ncbi:Alpha-D-glucose-1-phosphate phosphatase YihX [Aquisphaera giovannonii]|uniref:Alpha-D-glucose-1-phosphate phosphatase YihX n=1 Tax=Aquisphaera giovannonii TaxID=406548 RepID=A0A5B9VXZ5_9BACT|nr:HAD family phosphatase [Aquisphaera giovannonii]QEH33256.1 Alpha-D-glucose-1-phosphate phosphatase YihX [Aquisphaera giovannonii]
MRQPVLIFDFGNVVGFFDYSGMYERFGRRLGMSGMALEETLSKRGVAAAGRDFELGRIGADEFARRVTGMAGLEMSFEDFEAEWPDIFTLNEPVARLVEALDRAGYTLLLGSNTNPLHAACFRVKFRETLDRFDHLVLSYEVGVMKPDAAFFEACVALAGVPAESCVFIDDAEANVAGAIAAGLRGVVYRDPESLASALARMGVEGTPGGA